MIRIAGLLALLMLPTLALAGSAAQASAAEVSESATLLSRYPAGSVPVEPRTMHAIRVLAEHGGRGEVSLLRSLVDAERPEVRTAATVAIGRVRARQLAAQRRHYADTLPNWPELEERADAYRERGLGIEESICVAYADHVLVDADAVRIYPVRSGDPEDLLAAGQPRKALAAAAAEDGREARLMEARAAEELGDVDGAVRRYALLAAQGDQEGLDALEGFSVQSERLLLGMFAHPGGDDSTEAEVLEVLVREGSELTVTVLAERSQTGDASDRLTAADALGRMLDPGVRREPLSTENVEAAQRALVQATLQGPDPVRTIAIDLLTQ